MRSLSGHTLGSYKLIDQVGLGGMAIVYKAFDPALDRYVAIKILPEYLGLDENFSSRFRNEARQVARLSHPYIMPVFTYGEDDGLCYFVMELVEAGTLKELMINRLSSEQKVAIVTKLADALGYAHQRGIVHRDIKPANVLMPAPDRPLLTDFGIAKVLESSAAMTRSGFFGTPHYMAPEQTLGQPVSPQTDQYALGIVLYELLTGTTPFQADTPQAVALQHVYASLPFPRERNPLISPQMERVILKSLSKHPEDRYPDMTAFVAAIEAAPITSDGTTMVPSHGVPPTEYTEEHAHLEPGRAAGLHGKRGIAVGGLTALALVAVAIVVFLRSTTTAPHPARHAAPQHPGPTLFSELGAVHGSEYTSGGVIGLRWTYLPNARVYSLQVATQPADPPDAIVFKHPILSKLIERSSYQLRVVGQQRYYWRVRARLGANWTDYSRSRQFLVARPSIEAPRLLAPPDGMVHAPGRIRLCWSAAPGASAYDVLISRRKAPLTVHGVCLSLSLSPGSYHWSVAGLVRGVRMYAGAYARSRHFTIRALSLATVTPISAATPSPRRVKTSQPAATPRPTPAPSPTLTPVPRLKSRRTAIPTASPTPVPRRRPRRTATPTASPTPVPRPTAKPPHKRARFFNASAQLAEPASAFPSAFKVYKDTSMTAAEADNPPTTTFAVMHWETDFSVKNGLHFSYTEAQMWLGWIVFARETLPDTSGIDIEYLATAYHTRPLAATAFKALATFYKAYPRVAPGASVTTCRFAGASHCLRVNLPPDPKYGYVGMVLVLQRSNTMWEGRYAVHNSDAASYAGPAASALNRMAKGYITLFNTPHTFVSTF